MTLVVLDVNVLVSAIMTPLGTPRQLLSAWRDGRFIVLTSEGIVDEIQEKLRNPRIGGAYGVTEDDIVSVRGLLLTQAQVISVPPQEVVDVTDDPEDDYVLATARLGQADFLVTGDRRLVRLREHGRTRIVTPREFWEASGMER